MAVASAALPALPSLPARRHLAARVAARAGILRAARVARSHRGLLVLTYHRIGDRNDCPVDEGLISGSAAQLRDQMKLLRRCTRVVSLEEVEACYRAEKRFRSPLALVTFDDAYRDNYVEAFPVLRELGIPAVFFVPTGLIGCGHVPWWDRIAYAVKNARADRCHLAYPELELTGLRTQPRETVAALLHLYKQSAGLDRKRFVAAVEEAAGVTAVGAPDVGELFASWDELREMAAGGMTLAAHTHSHRLLARLPYPVQRDELARCREVLKEQVGVETRALAYPVGKPSHFNDDTRRALSETGYRLAFSHYNGWNPLPADPYDIRRVRLEPAVTAEFLEAAVSIPSIFAR